MNNRKSFFTISLSQWKAFAVSFIAVFLMVALSFVRSNAPILAAPVLLKLNPQTQITPKLESKINNFVLIKNALSEVKLSDNLLSAKAFSVIDFDSGQVILEKNFSQKLKVASLTKIMTAVVTMDLSTSSELFTVSENAAKVIPTRMGVIPGQKWTRDELLNAILLTSSNDAAEVLKEGIDQKYEQAGLFSERKQSHGLFVWAMNAKAKFLGLKNTSFDNPQGFDGEDNFSSVEDLAILSIYAIKKYPEIAEIVAKDYQFYPRDSNHKQADLYNWNGLMGVYPGVSGIKIGNTDMAGVTTIVLSERNGKKLLTVLLGATGILERDLGAAELLDMGFKEISNLTPVNITSFKLKKKYLTWEYFN